MSAATSVQPQWRKQGSKVLGVVAWHGTLIHACAFVLMPIVLRFFGSFKSVPEFFQKPYGLPESWSLENYRVAWDEGNLQRALANSVVSTGIGLTAGSVKG